MLYPFNPDWWLMSPEDIERHISRIAWGGKHISTKDVYGNCLVLTTKPLLNRDKSFIDMAYSQALQSAINDGIFTKIELIDRFKRGEVWTEKNEGKIKELTEEVDNLEKRKENLKIGSRDFKRLEKIINNRSELLYKLLNKRRTLFHVSAEGFAEEIKTLALIYCSTHDEFGNRYWKSWNDFLNYNDGILIQNIMMELNPKQLSVKELRLIARSPQWRFKWGGAKDIGNLFGKPILELSLEQQSLVYWSRVYDSVYDAYERPSEEIINDDELLDEWFEEQAKKREVEERKNSGKIGKLKLSNKMRKASEVFIVANEQINPSAPDIQQIEGMNSEVVRKLKRKELERVKKAGKIKEQHLRNTKMSRQLTGSRDAIISKRDLGGTARGPKQVLPGGSL